MYSNDKLMVCEVILFVLDKNSRYLPADTKNFDHTPHDIFVQMSELSPENTFWEERSRWIKYEECKEMGNHP